MGRDKLDVAKLLQRHNVIVRGGAEEGRKLLDALVVSSINCMKYLLGSPDQCAECVCWNMTILV